MRAAWMLLADFCAVLLAVAIAAPVVHVTLLSGSDPPVNEGGKGLLLFIGFLMVATLLWWRVSARLSNRK